MTAWYDLFTFNRLIIFLIGVGATIAAQWLSSSLHHRRHLPLRPVGIMVGTSVIVFGLVQNISLADEVRRCLIESGNLASRETQATTDFLVAINRPPPDIANLTIVDLRRQQWFHDVFRHYLNDFNDVHQRRLAVLADLKEPYPKCEN